VEEVLQEISRGEGNGGCFFGDVLIVDFAMGGGFSCFSRGRCISGFFLVLTNSNFSGGSTSDEFSF